MSPRGVQVGDVLDGGVWLLVVVKELPKARPELEERVLCLILDDELEPSACGRLESLARSDLVAVGRVTSLSEQESA